MTRQFFDLLAVVWAWVVQEAGAGHDYIVNLIAKYGELFSALFRESPASAPLILDCTIGLVLVVFLVGLAVVFVLLPLVKLLRSLLWCMRRSVRSFGLIGLLLILAAAGVCTGSALLWADRLHGLYDAHIVPLVPFLKTFTLSSSERILMIVLASVSVFFLGLGVPAQPIRLMLFAIPVGTLCCALPLPTVVLFLLAVVIVPVFALNLRPLAWMRSLFWYLRRPRKKKNRDSIGGGRTSRGHRR